MCGIAGVYSTRSDHGLDLQATVHRMLTRLVHRGPDGEGIAHIALDNGAQACFGHRRLSVIDLSSSGAQPMRTDRSQLVFNGEIYNYRALATDILGCSDYRGSDTRVLHAALDRWGARGADRLSGMYALAHLALDTGALTLLRDPFGVKPLYTYTDGNGLWLFASEIRALLASGVVPRTLSLTGVREFLHFGHAIGCRTLVRGVHMLEPGVALTISPSGTQRAIVAHRARRIPPAEGTASGFVRALEHSVREQLVSDRPLGVFLSGGLDSTIVTALAAEAVPKVETVSLVFPEVAKVDNQLSRIAAAHYGTTHHEIPLTRADVTDALDDALVTYDSPSYDGFNAYLVSRVARDAGLTVCLSGLGGDEYFGGYFTSNITYHLHRVPPQLRKLVPGLASVAAAMVPGDARSRRLTLLRRLASIGSMTPAECYAAIVRIFSSDEISALLTMPLPPLAVRAAMPFLTAYVDVSVEATAECDWNLFMQDQLLRDGDQMAMGSSIEVRFPFLNAAVRAEVEALPSALRFAEIPTKKFLQDAFADRLPAALLNRSKEGFSLPMGQWLGTHVTQRLSDVADSEAGRMLGLRADAVRALIAQTAGGDHGAAWPKLWSLLTMLTWIEREGITV